MKHPDIVIARCLERRDRVRGWAKVAVPSRHRDCLLNTPRLCEKDVELLTENRAAIAHSKELLIEVEDTLRRR